MPAEVPAGEPAWDLPWESYALEHSSLKPHTPDTYRLDDHTGGCHSLESVAIPCKS